MGTNERGLSPRLFVAGDSPDSATAIANLRSFFPSHESSLVEIEIVDVQQEPTRAAHDEIMVTPTLVKVSPSPRVRILGNLKNREALLQLLGIERPRPDPD